jgi:hypothetical protein
LDLLLFNRTDEPCGAHVAVYLGQDGAVHLSQEVGRPVVLPLECPYGHGMELRRIDDHADTDSNAGGARAAIAKMTDEVTISLAAFINAHPHERVLRVDVRGMMRSENKGLRKSDSYVEVTAAR